MINRGEIYWNVYMDSLGRERHVPVMIVSDGGYNERSDYVSAVRLVRFDREQCARHIPIPADAISNNRGLQDCVALTETLSSIRKGSLQGPVGFVISPYYIEAVMKGIRYQLGMEKEPPMQGTPIMNTPSNRDWAQNWGKKFYSAAHSPQMRETMPTQEAGEAQ